MAADDESFRNLGFTEDAAVFASAPQNVRLLSEDWVAAHAFCPGCGAKPLTALAANSALQSLLPLGEGGREADG